MSVVDGVLKFGIVCIATRDQGNLDAVQDCVEKACLAGTLSITTPLLHGILSDDPKSRA